MYCPKCGNPVNESDKFCANCAQNLNHSKNYVSKGNFRNIIHIVHIIYFKYFF